MTNDYNVLKWYKISLVSSSPFDRRESFSVVWTINIDVQQIAQTQATV